PSARVALISAAEPTAQMASSTASSTCAAAKLAAVAAHRRALVTDRTGMAITGTIASGHAASMSARRYPSASRSSVLQTRLHPAETGIRFHRNTQACGEWRESGVFPQLRNGAG